MAKQDILDAIDATIINNGVKGITADSLRNILTMMVENAGENGDGALRVIVPDMVLTGPGFIESGEFSLNVWSEIKPSLEQELGVSTSAYEDAINAAIQHNANVAQQIFDKAKVGQSVQVILDQNPLLIRSTEMVLQAQPDLAESAHMLCSQPAVVDFQYIKYTQEGIESAGFADTFGCNLIPCGPSTSVMDGSEQYYPSIIVITLNIDGTLSFTPRETNSESGS